MYEVQPRTSGATIAVQPELERSRRHVYTLIQPTGDEGTPGQSVVVGRLHVLAFL
jgi:hypothetical protein